MKNCCGSTECRRSFLFLTLMLRLGVTIANFAPIDQGTWVGSDCSLHAQATLTLSLRFLFRDAGQHLPNCHLRVHYTKMTRDKNQRTTANARPRIQLFFRDKSSFDNRSQFSTEAASAVRLIKSSFHCSDHSFENLNRVHHAEVSRNSVSNPKLFDDNRSITYTVRPQHAREEQNRQRSKDRISSLANTDFESTKTRTKEAIPTEDNVGHSLINGAIFF